MKSSNKKILLGTLSLAAVVAPVTTLVACGSSSSNIEKPSDPNSEVWTGKTVQQLKDDLKEQDDAATASSNFLSQIKYEAAETYYTKEQKASFEYQRAFLKWKIYSSRKELLVLAKEILSVKNNGTITTSQITTNPTPSGTDKFIGSLLSPAQGTYDLEAVIDSVSKMNDANINDDKKAIFNSKLATFKTSIDDIKKQKDFLENISPAKEASFDWKQSNIATNYPQLLKPVSEIRDIQQKVYNEAKSAFIDNYKTGQDGTVEWAKERTSKYNGASTDEEAIKYLVNQAIQSTAFGMFNYSLNETYTIEQFLVKGDDGKRIFPWFEGKKLGDKNTALVVDNNNIQVVVDENKKLTLFTNDTKDFIDQTSKNLIDIDTVNIKDQADTVTPLLGNKVYFLGRNTKVADKMIADLNDQEETKNFGSTPIMLTHALMEIKPGAGSTLPYTIDKAKLASMLSYYGTANAEVESQGMQMFDNIFQGTTAADIARTKLFVEHISDDTGSRVNSGELGIKSILEYSKAGDGGMNDGFMMGALLGFADTMNSTHNLLVNGTNYGIATMTNGDWDANGNWDVKATTHPTIEPGLKLVQDIIKNVHDAIPTGTWAKITPTTPTSEANRIITQYITSLSDDEVKNKFGNIFTDIFQKGNGRELAYKVADKVYLVVSPDSGIHLIQITNDAQDWHQKLLEDLKKVADEKTASKAKVKWTDVYKNIFTEEKIVESLLKDADVQKTLLDVVNTNTNLIDEWTKAKFFTFSASATTPELKRDEIIAAAQKAIDAIKLEKTAKASRDAIGNRVNTWLVGQMDNHFIDGTIDVDKLYDALLNTLEI